MTYDVTTGAPASGSRPRPGTVSAAGALLYVAAALIIINVITTASIMGRELDATKEAYQSIENGDTVVSITRIASIGGLIFDVLVAVVFAIFAFYNLKGRNGIRIATWVVGGLAVLCFGCGALGSGVSTSMTVNSSQSPEIQEASKKVADSLPSWATTTSITIDVLLFIVLALVIILLAVPASNAYFRKPEPPALPYPSYPIYPPAR